MSNNDSDGKGGYGKPPKRFQWAKGQSGNPKGRPKNSPERVTFITQTAFKRLLIKTTLEPIDITENGVRITVPKLQAIIKQLNNKAMSGNIAASKLILQHFGDYTEKIEKQDNAWHIEESKLNAEILRAMEFPGSLECYNVKCKSFMFRRDMRYVEGVDAWPFEVDEPVTNEDWYEFMKIHRKLRAGEISKGAWPPPYPSREIHEEDLSPDDENNDELVLAESEDGEEK